MRPRMPVSFFALTAFVLASVTIPSPSFSQLWDRYDIGESGCSVYFPYAPEWDLSYAEDSSLVWVGEISEGEIYYGVICVEFYQPFYDATEDELNSVAETYLDFLMGQFNIVSHTGYDPGYWMESNEDATGVADSWEDIEGDTWAIRAWIDPFNMAVLYIYSSPENSFTDNEEFFLNSFRFPEY